MLERLPAMLVEVGIADEEQAEHLARLIAEADRELRPEDYAIWEENQRRGQVSDPHR